MAKCGIDLGTTFSAISWYDDVNRRLVTIDLNCEDGQRMIRSVVYFPGDGKPPVVGKYALNAKRQSPDRVVVGIKRAMGNATYRFGPVDGKEYTPQEVSAEILKKLIEEAAHFVGEEVTDVVVTVPAYFEEAQKNATMEAAVMAMLKKTMDQIPPDEFERAKQHISLLEEPQAAALAYCIAKVMDIDDKYILVYDLGGGTFDVVLVHATSVDAQGKKHLKLETLNVNGNSNLGGLNWDEEMAKLVDGKIQAQAHPSPRNDPQDEAILLDNSEQGKRALSFTSPTFVVGDRAMHQAEVSQAEFEDATRALIQETKDLLLVVLEQAEKRGIPRDKIDVLLSGGSTRMPMCEKVIKEATGKDPLKWDNPDYLVSMGAAYWAFLGDGGQIIVRQKKQGGVTTETPVQVDSKPAGISTYAVGVEVCDRQGNRSNDVVLPVGSAFDPGADVEKEYYKISDDATEIAIVLTWCREKTTDLAHPGMNQMATFIIGPLPPGGKAGDPVRVKLGHTADGIIHGEAEDVKSGIKVPIKVDRIPA
jgi:molecular chaperone DnaK